MDKVKQLLKKFYANKILFIIVCVICLTSLTIGVSYSAFFSVKTNSVNQVVSTGSLNVTYSGNNSVIAYDYIEPLTDEEGMSQTSNRIVTVQNTSTLDSKYTVTIGYDMTSFLARSDYNSSDELTPIEYARLALYEYDTTNSTSTLISGPISIAELPIYSIDNSDSRYNKYSLLIDTVGSTTSGNATKTYQIKIWLSDDATAAATDTYFYFNTEVVARPQNDTLNYTINGILKNESGTAISGATISLHNGSIVTTTGTNGAFTLSNVPVGTYNLDVTASNVRYKGNITIKEGSQKSIKNLGSQFSASNNNIYDKSYYYKTTPYKIIDANSINDITSLISLSGYYSLYPTYELTGGYDSALSTLVLKIGSVGNFKIVRDMYFDGEVEAWYWNDDYYGNIYTFPNVPAAVFSNSQALFSRCAIKTTSTEHLVCVIEENEELCSDSIYWDTDSTTTLARIKNVFGISENDLETSCVNYNTFVQCDFNQASIIVFESGGLTCIDNGYYYSNVLYPEYSCAGSLECYGNKCICDD